MSEPDTPELPPEIDTSRPHAARVYDYFLGGENHFPADRAVAEKSLASVPSGRIGAREQRAFLGRAVRYLVGEEGIGQFLDIGAGLPAASNVHEVAQAIAPSARVAYVDNDPLVLAHARVLLASSEAGRTTYTHADLRSPGEILSSPGVSDVLDFSRPVALMLVGILHFLEDEEGPGQIIGALLVVRLREGRPAPARASGAPSVVAASSEMPSSPAARAVLPLATALLLLKGWLRLGDAQAFTGAVPAEIARRLLAGQGRPGAYTPGALFGPSLAEAAGADYLIADAPVST
jgi:hypothetical protein